MLPVSDEQYNAYHNDDHHLCTLVLFPDALDYNLDDNNIVADSLKITEMACDGTFKIGTANASMCEVEFGRDSSIGDADIQGQEIRVYQYSIDDSTDTYEFMNSVPTDVDKVAHLTLTTTVREGYVTATTRVSAHQGGTTTIFELTFTVDGEGESKTIDYWIPMERGYVYSFGETTIWADSDGNTIGMGGTIYPTIIDVIPLGVFYVNSCPVESNEPTRKLKAYDKLYSSWMDEGISYPSGTQVTMNNLLEEVDDLLGSSFAETSSWDYQVPSYTDTGETTEYTWTLANGCEIVIGLKQTRLKLSDYTYGIQHLTKWNSARAYRAFLEIHDRLYSAFGLQALIKAFPDEYAESTLYNFDETLWDIFRPTLEWDEDGYAYIQRYNFARQGSDEEGGRRYVAGDVTYTPADLDALVSKTITTSQGGYMTSEWTMSSYTDKSLYTYWDLSIMGKTIRTELRRADIWWTGTNVPTGYVVQDTYWYMEDYIGVYLLGLRDRLISGGFATKNNSVETDDYTNIIFYNDDDNTQYTDYYLMCQDIIEIVEAHTRFNANKAQIQYTAGAGSTTSYFYGNDDDYNMYTAWKSTYPTNSKVCFLDFPMVLVFKDMGEFVSDSTTELIGFGRDYSQQTDEVWDESLDLLGVWEISYTNVLAGLSFVADADVSFTPRDVLEAWAECNGYNIRIDRRGTPELYKLDMGVYFAVYPSDSLYPSDALYPNDEVEGGEYHEIEIDQIASLTEYSLDTPVHYKGVRLELSDGWEDGVVYDETADDDALFYDVSNALTLNFSLDGDDSEENFKKPIRDAIWETINSLYLISFEADIQAKPYMEIGDEIVLTTNDLTIDTVLLKRTIKGTNVIKDSFDQSIGG